MTTQFPIKRSQLKPGECLCSYCTALCCRYFSLPIDKPETWEEFDTVRWFMFHGRVSIYVDDDTWYICVYADCRHLQPDNSCGIYEDRPQICRDYSTNDCEYDDDGVHDLLFETPEQLMDYAAKILPPRDAPQNGRSPKRVKKSAKAGKARNGTNGASRAEAANGQNGNGANAPAAARVALPILTENDLHPCLTRLRGPTPAPANGRKRKRRT